MNGKRVLNLFLKLNTQLQIFQPCFPKKKKRTLICKIHVILKKKTNKLYDN